MHCNSSVAQLVEHMDDPGAPGSFGDRGGGFEVWDPGFDWETLAALDIYGTPDGDADGLCSLAAAAARRST